MIGLELNIIEELIGSCIVMKSQEQESWHTGLRGKMACLTTLEQTLRDWSSYWLDRDELMLNRFPNTI